MVPGAMTRWQTLSQPDIPADLQQFAGDPLLAQLLVQRGLTTVDQARAFLDPACYQPAPPAALNAQVWPGHIPGDGPKSLTSSMAQ